MSITMLLCLLPIKHLLIANVLDWGYSKARDINNRFWGLWCGVWLMTECVATQFLLPMAPNPYLSQFPLLEITIMLVAVYYERHALLGRELSTHIVWEIILMVAYAVAIFSTL